MIVNVKIIFINLLMLGYMLGQAQILVGVGYNRGYRSTYQEEGILMESLIKNHVNINLGYSNGKYNGVGLSGELNYLFLKSAIKPYFGVAYSYNNGREVLFKNDNLVGKYKIPINSFFYTNLGCSYLFYPKDPIGNLVIAVKLSGALTYRKSLSNINITYLEGDQLPNAEINIKKRVENGFGVYGTISILFGKRKAQPL